MWNPGFDFNEQQPGRIHGFHRCLCVRSTIYRGTPDHPGLVLGLDRGGSCAGLAFQISAENVDATLNYLDEREQVTKVYCPHIVNVFLADGRAVKGFTYVVRRDHEQYARLSFTDQSRLVAEGVGQRGSALDYLSTTLNHLNSLGLRSGTLHRVLANAQTLAAARDRRP
jgi:cation transport protein ChaC